MGRILENNSICQLLNFVETCQRDTGSQNFGLRVKKTNMVLFVFTSINNVTQMIIFCWVLKSTNVFMSNWFCCHIVIWLVSHMTESFIYLVLPKVAMCISLLVYYNISWVGIFKFNCYVLSIGPSLVKIICSISSLITEQIFSQAGKNQSWLLCLIVRSVLW